MTNILKFNENCFQLFKLKLFKLIEFVGLNMALKMGQNNDQHSKATLDLEWRRKGGLASRSYHILR